MTPLTRPVRRTVRGRDGEPLVVMLTEEGVYVRPPRQRVEYPPIPYGALLLMAARAYNAERGPKKRRATR